MEIRKWLHKDVHDRLDAQKADLEVLKAEIRGRIYHAVSYAVKALSDSEVRNTKRNEMVEARQTALGETACGKVQDHQYRTDGAVR